MEATHPIQFQKKHRSPKWKLGFALTLAIAAFGIHRAFMEFAAWDSAEDIFFDLGEAPDEGFRMLHSRWESFHPWPFPNTKTMVAARQMAGCCLLLRFWDRLSPSERANIIEDAKQPYGVDDDTREKEQLILLKSKIETQGYQALSEPEKGLWILHSRTFGNRNTPPNIKSLEKQALGKEI